MIARGMFVALHLIIVITVAIMISLSYQFIGTSPFSPAVTLKSYYTNVSENTLPDHIVSSAAGKLMVHLTVTSIVFQTKKVYAKYSINHMEKNMRLSSNATFWSTTWKFNTTVSVIDFLQKMIIFSDVMGLIIFIMFLFSVVNQLTHWHSMHHQGPVLIFLLAPTVIASLSILGLHFMKKSYVIHILLDGLKECYSGLVLILFRRLLYTLLTESCVGENFNLFLSKKRVRHVCIVHWFLSDYNLNVDNIRLSKYIAWSCLCVRIVTTVLALILEGFFSYPTIMAVVMFFVNGTPKLLAFYTIYIFYKSISEDLIQHNRSGKLKYIDIVTYFPSYQDLVIQAFALSWSFDKNFFLNKRHIVSSIENFLLTLEMIALSYYGYFVFKPKWNDPSI